MEGDRRHGTLVQHEDGRLDARLAQLHALVHRCHGQLVGPRLQHNLRAAHRAMAIGVGLYRAHELDVPAQALLQGAHVALNCPKVDLDPCPAILWTSHRCHLKPPDLSLKRHLGKGDVL